MFLEYFSGFFDDVSRTSDMAFSVEGKTKFNDFVNGPSL